MRQWLRRFPSVFFWGWIGGALGLSLMPLGALWAQSGLQAEQLGDYPRAVAAYARGLGPDSGPALALARCQLALTDYAAARQSLQHPAARNSVGAYHILWAQLYLENGRLDSGRWHLEQLSPLLSRHASLRPQWYYWQGRINMQQGNWAAARDSFLRGLDLAQGQDSSLCVDRGQLQLYLGVLALQTDQAHQAPMHFEAARRHWQECLPAAHPKWGFLASYRGYAAWRQDEIRKGLRWLREAERIQRAAWPAHHPELGRTYFYLGNLHSSQRDYAAAMRFHERAREIFTACYGPTHRSLGAIYNSLGLAYRRMKQFAQARQAFGQALEIYRLRLPSTHLAFARIHYNLALVAKEAGNETEALAELEKSRTIRLQHVSPDAPQMVPTYTLWGEIYEAQEKFTQALPYFERVIALAEEKKGQVRPGRLSFAYTHLGRIHRKLGQYAQSLAYHQKSLHALDPQLSAEALIDNPKPPFTANPENLLTALYFKGYGLYAIYHAHSQDSNHLRLALETLERGAELIDSMRSSFLSEAANLDLSNRARRIYQHGLAAAFELYELTGALRYVDAAFRLSERSKAFGLLSQMQEVLARESAGIPEALLDREQALRRELSQIGSLISRSQATDSLQQRQFHLERAQDSLLRHFEQAYPQYFALKYALPRQDIQSARQLLDGPNQAMIAYVMAPDYLYTLYLSQDKANFLRAAHDTLGPDPLIAMREALLSPEADEAYVTAAHQLYREWVAPFHAQESDAIQRWILLPDPGMSYLNFETLLMEAPAVAGNFRQYPYLLRERQISYAYSAALLAQARAKSEPAEVSQAVLAFAPSFNGPDQLLASRDPRAGYQPLAHSQAELEGLNRWFSCDIYTGTAATKAEFLAHVSRHRLIHLASHAQAGFEDPWAAHLAFAPAIGSNAVDSLRLMELYNLRLQADLVVLSACETGVGKLYQGEGIMSLARGFTYAGARSLVSSLWQVNDAATAEIMGYFYQRLAKGMDKDAALRQAKLDYLARHDALQAHPYFWGAFVALGDMEALAPSSRPAYSLAWGLLGLGLLILVAGYLWRKRRHG